MLFQCRDKEMNQQQNPEKGAKLLAERGRMMTGDMTGKTCS